ncbi:LmeA family phospholipid-binding protein [Streptomyces sp. NBC_00344]|uniref:LmeA family phospholipid-binding protein n=1 Tax=Streptomyces sp. NBC_00344 TaxID=2975720 RepID=UPI002E225290
MSTLTLTAFVALLAGANLAARLIIEQRIASVMSRMTGSDPDVEPSGQLSLLAVLSKHVAAVDVTSHNTKVGTFSGARVHIRLDDVRFGSGRTSIGSSQAAIDIPAAAIAQQIGAGGITVAEVRPDAAAGTLTLRMGPGGIAQVVLRPEADSGRLTLSLGAVEIFGRPAPEATRRAIEAKLPDGSGGTSYPLGMSVRSAEVTSEGLHVVLHGARTSVTSA